MNLVEKKQLNLIKSKKETCLLTRRIRQKTKTSFLQKEVQ